MQIPDEIRLGLELLGLAGTGGMLMFKLGRLGEKFDGHAIKLEKVETAVDKIEDALATVAVQKEEIKTVRETEASNTRRTDETFTRVFAILDRLQARA